jgi:hypothetical protein
MRPGVGVHAVGDGRCLYSGEVIPFLCLRDGTQPLAARTGEPRPLAEARQIRPAAPVDARKGWGPGRRRCIDAALEEPDGYWQLPSCPPAPHRCMATTTEAGMATRDQPRDDGWTVVLRRQPARS